MARLPAAEGAGVRAWPRLTGSAIDRTVVRCLIYERSHPGVRGYVSGPVHGRGEIDGAVRLVLDRRIHCYRGNHRTVRRRRGPTITADAASLLRVDAGEGDHCQAEGHAPQRRPQS